VPKPTLGTTLQPPVPRVIDFKAGNGQYNMKLYTREYLCRHHRMETSYQFKKRVMISYLLISLVFGQHAPGVVFGQSIPNGHEEDGPISKVVGIWPVEQTNVICGERKDEDLVLSGNITLKNSYVIVECPRVAT
jgi:hypothetical protein